MADLANTTLTPKPSRRGVVFYGSALVAAATLAKPITDIALDAIEDHRQKRAALEAFCDAHDNPGAHEDYDSISDPEWDAWHALCQCRP